MNFEEFKENEINQILLEIDEHLEQPIKTYVFGGAVMVFRGIKSATKDIDIIFENEPETKKFIQAAKKVGFKQTVPQEEEYSKLQMHTLLEHFEKKWRLDIFLKKFAGAIQLTKTIMKRSKPFEDYKKLELYLVSNEDLFMLKAMTERDRDLEDMRLILGFGLDWKVIEKEVHQQKEHELVILYRISQFSKKYDVQIPFNKKTRKKIE